MPLFRKKPVVIEAHRLVKEGPEKLVGGWPQWLQDAWHRPAFSVGAVWPCGDGMHALQIGTLEGDHRASWGDWIIRGVKGELYPCKPDIFEATYEVVEMPRVDLDALADDMAKMEAVAF